MNEVMALGLQTEILVQLHYIILHLANYSMRSMINFCLSICAAAIIGSCTKENIDSGKTLPSSKIADITEYAIHKNGEDWADAFEIALTERDTIFVPQGEYKCSEIRVPSGKTIIGSGNKTVFTPLGTRLFIIEGVKHEGVEISSDISDYTNKIYLKQHLDLQPGDDILIQSQRNSMLREGIAGVNYDIDWVLGRTRKSSVFFGEFDEVLSKVVPFSEIITYASQKLFLMYLRSSLTDAMFQHLMRETGAEDKLRGKTITEDEWQSILSVPPNRIGYTKYTANRAAQYRPTPAKVAPRFEQKTPAAMEDAYNDGEDPNDDLDYGTAKAPSAKEPAAEPKPAQETAAKVSKTEPAAAQDEEEITEEQRTTRKCIEAMRATGCKDSAIPPQLFIQAGWKVPQGNLEEPAQ